MVWPKGDCLKRVHDSKLNLSPKGFLLKDKQLEFNFSKEKRKRDDALDLLALYRRQLIGRAKEIALDFVKKNGTVTAPQIVRQLKSEHAVGINQVDLRFMGCVFRKGWIRRGFINQGSHCQPISVWALDFVCKSEDQK